MGRGIRYLAAWSASTTVAVALSWLGVRSVLGAGVPQAPPVMAGPAQQTTSVVVEPTTTTIVPTTTTPEPPPPTTTTVPPTTKPTPPPPADGAWTGDTYVRSFQLAGGEAAVRFSRDGTTPISATPRQGFAVNVQQPDGTLVVEFQSPNRRSRLEASWQGGPQWKIVEAG